MSSFILCFFFFARSRENLERGKFGWFKNETGKVMSDCSLLHVINSLLKAKKVKMK